MQRLVVLVAVVCVAVVGWALTTESHRQSGAEARQVGDVKVLPPLRHGRLAVFPVVSTVPKHEDRFITLDEGLQAGTVEIFEIGADGNRDAVADLPNLPSAPPGAQETEQQPVSAVIFDGFQGTFPPAGSAEVNRLAVVNRSGKPLYLMPGEVLVGGQQDRTIGEETIIAATGNPVPVDVFCVEHGRWSGRGESENAHLLAAVVLSDGVPAGADDVRHIERLAAETARGKFVASAGSLSKASRLAAQATKDQSAVWDAVAQANAAAGVSPDSGAFTANYVDPRNRERLQRYMVQLEQQLAGTPGVVGVIVAIDGKVEAADVFESTPLFRKLWPKLLKSYALDAAVAEAGPRRPGRRSEVADASRFLEKAFQSDVAERSEGQGGLMVTRRATDGVLSFQAGDAADSSAMGGGGFGGTVHTSAFAH